jgi:hypothetical protein
LVANSVFAEVHGQDEQSQVALVGFDLVGGLEPIIRLPEYRPGEEFLPVDVTGEGARLANQRGDDVPIVDPRQAALGSWTADDKLAEIGETDGILAYLNGERDSRSAARASNRRTP